LSKFKKNESENNDSAAVGAPPVKIVEPPPFYTPTLVYSGNMDQQVYMVKHFSLVTSVIILLAQPMVWYRMHDLTSPILKSAIGGGMAFFFMATPILIHSFTKKYVLRLTLHDETKEFEATTYSLFLIKKSLKFKQEDIVIPPTPLPFTTIYAKGVPLLLTPDGWKSRYAYDHLMLLDKTSIDWSQLKSDLKKDSVDS